MLVSVPTGSCVTSGHDFSAKICRTPLHRCYGGPHRGQKRGMQPQPNQMEGWPGPEPVDQQTRTPEMVTPGWYVGCQPAHAGH